MAGDWGAVLREAALRGACVAPDDFQVDGRRGDVRRRCETRFAMAIAGWTRVDTALRA
jgi:hypothetical protein